MCILHKPGKKFETSWTYEQVSEEPFDIGYDQSTRGYFRLDFCRAPLYSMIEFFLVKQTCKQHRTHYVLSIGKHLGEEFKW